jgi:hypothetical protein
MPLEEQKGSSTHTHRQLVLVAVLVCFFAASMAGMLNFFKYRALAERLVHERLVVTGQGIEASIRSSLALGMQFADIVTLQDKLERELRTDDITRTIQVFDVHGETLYSTDSLRAFRGVPTNWFEAAKDADGGVWTVKDGVNSAVGVSVRNSIGLVVGHLALRYDENLVQAPIMNVARRIALTTFVTFVVSALMASLALLAVLRGIAKDMDRVEAYVDAMARGDVGVKSLRGPFARPVRRFLRTVGRANRHIHKMRATLRKRSATGTGAGTAAGMGATGDAMMHVDADVGAASVGGVSVSGDVKYIPSDLGAVP